MMEIQWLDSYSDVDIVKQKSKKKKKKAKNVVEETLATPPISDVTVSPCAVFNIDDSVKKKKTKKKKDKSKKVEEEETIRCLMPEEGDPCNSDEEGALKKTLKKKTNRSKQPEDKNTISPLISEENIVRYNDSELNESTVKKKSKKKDKSKQFEGDKTLTPEEETAIPEEAPHNDEDGRILKKKSKKKDSLKQYDGNKTAITEEAPCNDDDPDRSISKRNSKKKDRSKQFEGDKMVIPEEAPCNDEGSGESMVRKKSKKKKERSKQSEGDVTLTLEEAPYNGESLDERMAKKKSKKRKYRSEQSEEEKTELPVISEVVKSPRNGEGPNESIVKKKSKKKKDRPNHSEEEKTERSLIPDDSTVHKIDGLNEKFVTKKSKKKKDQSNKFEEEKIKPVLIPGDVITLHIIDDTDESPTKKKTKKSKSRSELSEKEETVSPLISEKVIAPDNDDVMPKKKRKTHVEVAEIVPLLPTKKNVTTNNLSFSKQDNIDALTNVGLPKKNRLSDQSQNELFKNAVAAALEDLDDEDDVPSKSKDGSTASITVEEVEAFGKTNALEALVSRKRALFQIPERLNETSVVTAKKDFDNKDANQSNSREVFVEGKILPSINECLKLNLGGKLKLLENLSNDPVCPYCNKLFSLKTSRNHHVRAVHLKIKDYKCSFCGEAFSEKQTLKVHMYRHTDEWRYQCRRCFESFRNSSNLHRHMRCHFKWDEEIAKRQQYSLDYATKKIKKTNYWQNFAVDYWQNKNIFGRSDIVDLPESDNSSNRAEKNTRVKKKGELLQEDLEEYESLVADENERETSGR